MRLLEHHNPEVEFDWPRLLREVPQDPAARRDRDRDPRDRDRRDRRDGRDHRSAPRPRPHETTAAAAPPLPPPGVAAAIADAAEERAAAHAHVVLDTFEPLESLDPGEPLESEEPGEPPVDPLEPPAESLAITHGEPLAADHSEYVEFAEASHTRPEPAEPREPREAREPLAQASAAAARLGPDALARLRARYAQLAARIAEKPMDDAARVELNAQVERLNPDAWRTPDEVAAALEQYETVFERVRADVGPPRRR